ncbi:MAG: TerB family tellurite resistance protein [Deltaproteobacteria bacterium]|nr:TerB family tellurite resistance protein [Deltaproteobacteria bacterium]
MLDKLSREDRMRLMRFVCSFAWADLEVQAEERSFVKKLVRKLKLTADEKKQVDAWLAVPPSPEEVDPTDVPKAHRQLFLNTIREIVTIDGLVDPEEDESFALLEQLLG